MCAACPFFSRFFALCFALLIYCLCCFADDDDDDDVHVGAAVDVWSGEFASLRSVMRKGGLPGLICGCEFIEYINTVYCSRLSNGYLSHSFRSRK